MSNSQISVNFLFLIVNGLNSSEEVPYKNQINGPVIK